MPKNPFSANKNAVNKPNRNAFDLSFSNHLTLNFGQLIPVMCKEVLPGDTFKIDSALGLRFMPLTFPIQTKCRAHVHFFYQRTKNLWSEFQDFINGNDKLQNAPAVHPYINFNASSGSSLLATCSLGDYLGLPTVRYGLYGYDENALFFDSNKVRFVHWNANDVLTTDCSLSEWILGLPTYAIEDGSSYQFDPVYWQYLKLRLSLPGRRKSYSANISIPKSFGFIDPNNTYIAYSPHSDTVESTSNDTITELFNCVVVDGERYIEGVLQPTYEISFEIPLISHSNDPCDPSYLYFISKMRVKSELVDGNCICSVVETSSSLSDAVLCDGNNVLREAGSFHINALPFRCYESIYNAFYRDDRNNPLIYHGEPVYNKFLLNTTGGPDDYPYRIYQRNWELDQFTSAVSSPQQGAAPLVGITSTGDLTFRDDDGKEYTFSTKTSSDANVIETVKVTENIPNSVARSIVNLATSGISINDLRNVNAFQRWLETNIRRGLKYKDQILARWGVEPADSTLDMPEFIGGYSVDVDVNTITNTAESESSPLGTYAGAATAFGGSHHQISQFCDQHGYIMAILSVVPCPVYTQLLPKMFLRENAVDYYQPEFGQIGLQPITYKEICPIETYNSLGAKALSTVFGYQRPWYDYIYSNDEAHGLFRSSMNQFLMNRTFIEPPSLNSEFLTVGDSSLNDVFSVNQPQKILGMIRFNITAQRPIPSVSIPSL